MKIRTLIASTALGFAVFALPAQAQHTGHDMPATAAVSTELSSGEVRAIDLKTRKITLKHGELKNLGMSPMTMVFAIKAGIELPKNLKAGDPVRFRAEEPGGVLTVTLIQR
ncbi:copper-binding protein [Uliginosibacterium flavum]|uniref:Copper-binding protein n=1 Tax=Uliginosibacterium flavum TaxID=1396831 RepID=A0ABV2TM91_9RHOO